MSQGTEYEEQTTLVLLDQPDENQNYSSEAVNRNTVTLAAVAVFSVLVFVSTVLCVFLLVSPTRGAYGIASSNSYATAVGYRVLRAGGNAIDAAFAVQAILTLTEPMSSGFGGGCFIMYYMKNGTVKAIDGREEAPLAQTNIKPNSTGGAISGIPGTLAAMDYALNRYGTMKLSEVLAPAISLAKQGYVLDQWAADRIAEYQSKLSKFPASAALWLEPNLAPKKAGSQIKNLDYAKSLEQISTEGVQAFYNGSLGQKIIDAIQKAPVNPGVMTMDDLSNYRPVERHPLKYTYQNYTFFGMNMPSAGSLTHALFFNMLEFLESQGKSVPQFGTPDSLTLILNLISIAFADRDEYMADQDWVDVPVEGLLDKKYAQMRALLLNETWAMGVVQPGTPAGADGPPTGLQDDSESEHTSHFTIVDSEGNIACVTTTIESTFGSGMVAPGTGILLNNELGDFSSSGKNIITGGRKLRRTALPPMDQTLGGKRPRSSMSPTIVLKNNKPYLALGSPGGSNIISTVAGVLINIIELGMSPRDAVLQPRSTSQNKGTWSFEEQLFQNETLMNELKARGANPLGISEHGTGAIALIRLNADGSLTAVADPRKLGIAKVSLGEAYPN